MHSFVDQSRHAGIAVLTVQNPPVNALSRGVPEAILEAVDRCGRDPEVSAIVLAASGRTFIAGADISELQQLASEGTFGDRLQRFVDRLEQSSRPIVCAIHGSALGGGLETAMGCHYRIASPSARLGQPEVTLGLIPGAGGTQRLPRLVGVLRAATMCADGEPIDAKTALERQLIDRIADGELLPAAVRLAEEVAASERPIRRTCDREDRLGNLADYESRLDALREEIAVRRAGEVAPGLAIDAVQAAAVLPFSEGCRRELELFRECLASGQPRSMIRVFFAERSVQKRSQSPGLKPQPFDGPISVTGSAPMARHWTNRLRLAGLDVRAGDDSDAAGRDSPAPLLVICAPDPGPSSGPAIGEPPSMQPPTGDPPHRVLEWSCWNAAGSDRNESPPLSLVSISDAGAGGGCIEAWVADESDTRMAELLLGLGRRLGATLVWGSPAPSAIAPRVLTAGLLAAFHCVRRGASIGLVDRAWQQFGFAEGPFTGDDRRGLHHPLVEQSGAPGRNLAELTELRKVLVERGEADEATVPGWYIRDEAGGVLAAQPRIQSWIDERFAAPSPDDGTPGPAEIISCCLDHMVNEAAWILGQSGALSSTHLDIACVHGFGFPRFLGGPLAYADGLGLIETCERLDGYEAGDGGRSQVAPLLRKLAHENGAFGNLAWNKDR